MRRLPKTLSPKALLPSLILLALAAPTQAAMLVAVDKDSQTMTVTVDGQTRHTWPVSTGMAGYDTPNGDYKPFRMEARHFSREWDNAPMPNAIFFSQIGHAIHGTTQTRHLGRPASHGCVRLSPHNAATLFALVKQQKMANTRVVIEGSTAEPVASVNRPGAEPRIARRRAPLDGTVETGWGADPRQVADPRYVVGQRRRAYRDPFAYDAPYAPRGYDGRDPYGYAYR